MMIASILVHVLFPLLLLPGSSTAFSAAPRRHQRPSKLILFGVEKQQQDHNKDLTFNPSQGYRSVDIPRASYCAQHFGACPIEEIEDLHNNLHKERLQHFLFGVGSDPQHTTKEAMEHLVLEEELELQLSLLKDEIGSPNLFPHVEEPMEELPHLKDHSVDVTVDTIAAQDKKGLPVVEDVIHYMEQTAALQEPALMEESNLETLAMCAVVMALVMVPEVLKLLDM